MSDISRIIVVDDCRDCPYYREVNSDNLSREMRCEKSGRQETIYCDGENSFPSWCPLAAARLSRYTYIELMESTGDRDAD